jgi:hypothetical protein
MKKILLLVIIVVLFSGCQLVWEIQDDMSAQKIGTHELYYLPEFEELDSYYDIYLYIHERITPKKTDKALGPREALEKGYGDCTTYCVLFSNIAYFALGIEMDIIAVDHGDERAIGEGGFTNHAILYYGGVMIEPQLGIEVDYPSIPYIYEFGSFLR